MSEQLRGLITQPCFSTVFALSCFFVVLVTSAGVIRLQQIRRCFDDLIKLQSGCFAQNWDPKEERCTVSVSY